MKSTIFLLLILLPGRNEAQTVKSFLDAIVKSENYTLNKYLSNEVICNLEGSEINGKQNVLMKLTDFVSTNGIKSSKLIHEAVTKGKESFMGIGSLISDKSKYRVYLTFGSGENKEMVKDIKIEKDLF
ncbi:MAG: DUF4783 domain-containing protein [Saprospiraceae bacterium]|nr:DUF4783 domain-containing protein [Saprospiraceae bacterium]